MRKRNRALVALAAGGMLLGVSTGGTFALWSASEPITLQPQITGVLDLAHASNATSPVWNWSIYRASATPSTITPAQTTANTPLATVVQAGDVITATTFVSASLSGTNLVAKLTPTALSGLSVTSQPEAPPGQTVTEAQRTAYNNINLASWVTSVKVGTATAGQALTPLHQNTASREQIPVVVTIQVPASLPSLPMDYRGNITQDIKFGDFTLTLQQVRG